MKRPFLLALTGAVLVPVSPALIYGDPIQEDRPNLFTNGNMETAGEGADAVPVKGWEASSEPDLLLLEQGTNAHEGDSSLQITLLRDGLGRTRSNVIAVQPNTNYEIALAMQLSSPRVLPFVGIKVYESFTGWNPEEGYLIESTPSRDWLIKRASFTTGTDTKWIYIGVFLKGSMESSVSLDSIAIEKVD